MQRFLNAEHRGEQEVDRAGLDFLDGPRVKAHQFGQFFLRKLLVHPLTPDPGAKTFELVDLL